MTHSMKAATSNVTPTEEKAELSLNSSSTSLDKAAVYLHNHGQLPDEGSVRVNALLHKVDWRIMPLALACYAAQFIDKVNLNYAAVMGMNKDLKLVGNDFTNAATSLYIATLVTELATGYILQRFPPGKWLGLNVILWGMATASTAAVNSYRGLLACRICVGVFEAAMSPCLMLITGMWYTKPEAVRRFHVWFYGLGLGQILGGLISWGFQQLTEEFIAPWRVMFIVLGVMTSIVGFIVTLLMPDNPMSVKWLSDAEKTAVIQRVAVNQTGIQNKHFKWSHIRELVLDLQIWLLAILIALISVCSGVIATYSATVIRNFGYSSPHSALLNMPSGAVSVASAILSGYFVGRQSNRWLWISILCVPAVLGGALMSFLPVTNKKGQLAGIYLVNAVTPTLVLVYSWVVANVAGQTKRVFANAIISASFCIGSIIGPQTFRAKDAPHYLPAKLALLATQSVAIMVAVTARLYYGWQNSRKEKLTSTQQTIKDIEWLNFTDKENNTFRYQY